MSKEGERYVAELTRLEAKRKELEDKAEKYRLLIGLASAALKLGSDDDAYSLIERAYDL